MSTATGNARPLAGRRVLVTRPRTQAAELVRQLESAGAAVSVAPTIRVIPPDDRGPLLRAAADPWQFDWIVFSSANAVDAFLDAIGEIAGTGTDGPGSVSAFRLPQACAVGSRTAEQLRARGVEPALVPGEFKAEALVAALAAKGSLAGTRVLLPRSDIGRDVIANGLRSAGAAVTDVVAYRTVADEAGDGPDVRTMLANRELDAVTFTSGSAVRSFVQLHGPTTADLLRHTIVAVIGPVTGEVARELGIAVHVQPSTYTVTAMVDALADYISAR